MLRRLTIFILLIVFGAAFAVAQGDKLEPTPALADPGASDALKKALEPKGTRVVLGDGPYCDVWLRAGVPPGKTEAQGAVYTNFGESVLIGVISFAKATTDFRGQAVKPGTYTMRYAVHPTDGNHLGISPIRDFLVMLPVAMDQDPNAQPKFEELVKMSKSVTGTNHPGVLSLVQLDAAPASPKVETDEMNHVVVSTSVKSQSGTTIPIAFVVKGRAEQ